MHEHNSREGCALPPLDQSRQLLFYGIHQQEAVLQ